MPEVSPVMCSTGVAGCSGGTVAASPRETIGINYYVVQFVTVLEYV